MPDPDYKALCAELLAAMQTDDWEECEEVWARAKAALEARSEPVAPTDEELLGLYGVATPCYHIEEYRKELDYGRAVLARWGTPANTTREEN